MTASEVSNELQSRVPLNKNAKYDFIGSFLGTPKNMRSPIVSIVVPVFNRKDLIGRCLDSLLTQTVRDIEILVADDGSTDGTMEVLRRLKQGDDRIRILALPHSGKPALARNAAIREARGSYICFLDSDDSSEPQRIERTLEVFAAQPDAIAVFHDMYRVDRDGRRAENTFLGRVVFLTAAKPHLTKIGKRLYRCSETFVEFMSLNFTAISTCSIMVRAESLREQDTCFAEDVFMSEDTDLWLRLINTGAIYYLDVPLTSYREHDSNITKSHDLYVRDRAIVHTRNYARLERTSSRKFLRKYRKQLSTIWLNYAYILLRSRKILESRNAIRNSLRLRPSVKALRTYVATYFPRNARQT